MTEEKAKSLKLFLKKGEGFRSIYVTGAIGAFSPYDFRLLFYSHVPEVPEELKQTDALSITQTVQVEVVMSKKVAKELRDLIDRQIKEEEAKKTKEEG